MTSFLIYLKLSEGLTSIKATAEDINIVQMEY